MMDPLEAVAIELMAQTGDSYFDLAPQDQAEVRSSARRLVAVWVSAAVDPCSADHVELTVLGETIFADPAKCEWRCVPHLASIPHAAGCGWQPRWDVLNGGT